MPLSPADGEPLDGQAKMTTSDPAARAASLAPDAAPTGTSPLVSVIVRTCNRQRFLREALQSLQAQTCQDFEVVLVNDGGEDVSDIVAELSPPLRISYHAWRPSRGRPQALNTALKEAQGTYIAYLDDDDIYYPDHLETLATALSGSDCQVAYTDIVWAYQRRTPDGGYATVEHRQLHARAFDRDWLLFENYIPINAVMHARACLDVVGHFDEAFEVLEDWELWIRLALQYDFRHIAKSTAEYRKRDDGSNITDAPMKYELFASTTASLFAKYARERERAAQRLFEQMKGQLTPQEREFATVRERAEQLDREREAAVELLQARTHELEQERRRLQAIEHDLEQWCRRAEALERDLAEAVQRTQTVEKERDLLQAQLARIHNSLLYRLLDLEIKDFKEAIRRFRWKS